MIIFNMRTLKFDLCGQPQITACILCLTFFLLCLKHLHANGRKDDLFGDPCYQQFGEELNKVLKDWQPSVLPDGECSLIHSDRTMWSATKWLLC